MIDAFIKRREASAASERANYQLFLTELCAVLEAKQGAKEGDAKPGHGIRGSEGWDQSMVRAPTLQRLVDALAALGHVG